MKKIIALTMSALIFSNLASCSEMKATETKSYTAEKLSGKAYKKRKIDMPKNLSTLYAFRTSPSCNLILGAGGEISPVFFTCDSNCENFKQLELEDFSYGESYDICLCADGSIMEILVEKDEETEEYSYWIKKYSNEGKLLSSKELTDFYEVIPPSSLALSGLYSSDGENAIAFINGSFYAFSVEGKCLGEVKLSNTEHEIKEFGMDNKGQLWCTVKVDIDNVKLCKVNAAEAKVDENGNTYNVGGSIIAPISNGSGDYSMYLMGRTQFFGVKENGDIEPVFDITGSSLNTNKTSGFTFDSKGQLLAPLMDYSSAKFYRYEECDPAELENIPIVTLGTNGNSSFVEWADKINDEQSDYKVEIVDYSTDIIGSGNEKFREDILSGNCPDIIDIDYLSGFRLEDKGVYCDLYEFIDKDKTLSRDSFNENILNLMEKNGSIYTIYKTFLISTITGKTKYIGSKDSITADDYIEACENRPEGMEAFIYNNYCDILNVDSFVDSINKKCFFDSDQFLKVLEYTEQQEDAYVNNWDDGLFFKDIENPTAEELEKAHELSKAQDAAYINDQVMLSTNTIGDFASTFLIREENFGGEEVNHVGFITPDGSKDTCMFTQGLSIYSQSTNKEYAWDFVKKFLTEDLYDNNWYISEGFYVLNDRLEKMADNAVKPKEYPGNPDYHGYLSYLINEKEPKEIGMPTEKDINDVWDIINNVSITSDSLSNTALNIYYEEREKFYNKEYTAAQLAEILQNRLSIAVAE